MSAEAGRKIVRARITPFPRGFFEPLPMVYVELEGGGAEKKLFEYYHDEISFTPEEFVGLTIAEAHQLKFRKDKEYLQS